MFADCLADITIPIPNLSASTTALCYYCYIRANYFLWTFPSLLLCCLLDAYPNTLAARTRWQGGDGPAEGPKRPPTGALTMVRPP